MAKRLRLKLDQEIDFNLFAVVTSLRDFEFAFHLNRRLSFSFKKNKKKIWYKEEKIKKKITHTIFQQTNEEGVWNIIQNKGKIKEEDCRETKTKENIFAYEAQNTIRKSFIEEYKHIDYFLQTPDKINIYIEKEIQLSIKKMPNITTVFKLDTSRIKEIERFFFE